MGPALWLLPARGRVSYLGPLYPWAGPLQNGDGEIDADDLQEALAKAHSAQLKQDVEALIERHKRGTAGNNRCSITEDEWLEFNKPFVVGHKDNSNGRHRPTLLSTALLNVKEEALMEANPSNRPRQEPLRNAS